MIPAARSLAALLASLLGAYATVMSGASPVVVAAAVAGAAGVVVSVAGRWEWAAWTGVLLLGAAYVTALALRDGDVDPFAPAVAVGLYLIVEARDVASERAENLAVRAWYSLSVGFGSALLVAVLLLAGSATRAAGPVAVAASAVCGALLLSGLVWLAAARD